MSVEFIPPPELPGLIARLKPEVVVVQLTKQADHFSADLGPALKEASTAASGDNAFTKGWHTAPLPSAPGIIVKNTFAKAGYVENPTKPHIIEALKSKALSWQPKTGKRAFAKRVFHPGFRGYGIFQKTMAEKVPGMWRELSQRLKAFIVDGSTIQG